MLLDYINKVVQIWLLATTGISAITTTIIMIEYSFVIVTDLKKKITKQEVLINEKFRFNYQRNGATRIHNQV